MTMAIGELAGASGAADAAASTSGAGAGAAEGGMGAARGATGAAASGGRAMRSAAGSGVGGKEKSLRQKISSGEKLRSQAGSKAKSLFGPSKAARSRPRARQILVTEFVICALIIALMPLTDKHKADTPVTWGRRATAVMLLFVILALVATGGRRSAKIAAGFGGVVTVGLVLSERDLLTVLTGFFSSKSTGGPAGPGGTTEVTPSGSAGAFTGLLSQIEQGLLAGGNQIVKGFSDAGAPLQDFLHQFGLRQNQIGGPLVLPPEFRNP